MAHSEWLVDLEVFFASPSRRKDQAGSFRVVHWKYLTVLRRCLLKKRKRHYNHCYCCCVLWMLKQISEVRNIIFSLFLGFSETFSCVTKLNL